MKTAVIIILTGLCVWFIAPNLPAPSDVFKPQAQLLIIEKADIPAPITPPAPVEPSFNLIERDVFRLINDERENKGLHKLRWDENLHDMARKHSEWMAATGDFEHSGYNVFENCWWGIGYYENQLASICFSTWKDSKGHYENILEPSINYCAIGFAESDQGTFSTFMAK